MADEKKKPNPFLDVAAPFKGLTNIVSGAVFDPKSWKDEAPETGAKGTDEHGNEEVEETVTRRTVRGKRGAFTTAAPKGSGDGGKPGAGDDGKASTGAAPGKQDEGEKK